MEYVKKKPLKKSPSKKVSPKQKVSPKPVKIANPVTGKKVIKKSNPNKKQKR